MTMKISDKIRRWCKAGYDIDELSELADCIDSEMVELPKDRDGVPIHVGDTVYLDDGEKAEVTCIGIGMIKDSIYTIVYGEHFSLTPEHITNARPDSLERIATELEGLSVDSSDNYYVSRRASELADRIRKLAEKERVAKCSQSRMSQ